MDTYRIHASTVARLTKEYKSHPKLIIAVDFDDTFFPWTQENSIHDEVRALVRRCQKLGFYIVCFTASDARRYDFIRSYFAQHGVTLDSINVNPIPLPYGNNGKIFFNILLDDRSGLESSYATLLEVVEFAEKNPL